MKKIFLISLGLSSLLLSQTINLQQGWNLVGITQMPDDHNLTLGKLIDPNGIETIYNPKLGSVKASYLKYPTFRNKELEVGRGYWIKAKEDNVTISFKGEIVDINYSQILQTGWNLITYPRNDILGHFDSFLKTYACEMETIYNPKLGSVKASYLKYPTFRNKELNPNAGYWVKVKKAQLVLPNIDLFAGKHLSIDTEDGDAIDLYFCPSGTFKETGFDEGTDESYENYGSWSIIDHSLHLVEDVDNKTFDITVVFSSLDENNGKGYFRNNEWESGNFSVVAIESGITDEECVASSSQMSSSSESSSEVSSSESSSESSSSSQASSQMSSSSESLPLPPSVPSGEGLENPPAPGL